MVLPNGRKRWLSMMDIITNDNEGRQGTAPELFADTRDWEIEDDRWRAPAVIYPQRRTATASWQRSVLIITALSTLAWAAVVLVVIEVLAYL
jgi:hypothetical protein